MKLSIITINLNNKVGLKKTVDSVMSQTWRDFEWIIIDGGSTDGSKEVIEELAKNPLANISYWCSEKDKGVYNAMNKGIAKANGEYLQFLNSGDCFHSDEVLAGVTNELHDEVDILYGDVDFVSPTGTVTFHYPSVLTTHYFLYRSLGHPSAFIKAQLLKEKGYREDFKIVSDWYRFIEWFRNGNNFKHIDLIITDFDTGGVSNSNQDLLDEERTSDYKELFGEYNLNWIHESIEMQKLKEANGIPEYQLLGKILNVGGIRSSFTSFFLSFVNKTIK